MLKFWTLWRNQTSQFHEVVQSVRPRLNIWWVSHDNVDDVLYEALLDKKKAELSSWKKFTWTRSAMSAPMFSYLWAIDMTKRTLLIANFSLASEHSIILDLTSARFIFKEFASCSSEGSHPSFSFSLKATTTTTKP